MKSKNEAEDKSMDYVSKIETQRGVKVQKMWLDYGEVTLNNFKAYARLKGITHPKSNGKSKTRKRFLDKIKIKLVEPGVHKELWRKAIRCSA